jgi:hypothetical protein
VNLQDPPQAHENHAEEEAAPANVVAFDGLDQGVAAHPLEWDPHNPLFVEEDPEDVEDDFVDPLAPPTPQKAAPSFVPQTP